MRKQFASLIIDRIKPLEDRLREEFRSAGRIASFVVDDLLPLGLARQIHGAFPETGRLVRKKNLAQDKYVGVQMDLYDPMLEEIIYGFQEPGVIKLIERITGLEELLPDRDLYAGGISVMCEGNFLNPHLDNSHDKDRKLFRALNLLYYVSPEWKEEYGGNLELWDEGPGNERRTLASVFNRLVVMMTNKSSWHSVSPVVFGGRRCCISNYYFSSRPVDSDESYHVTSFRGRPGETLKDLAMQADNLLRTAIKKTTGEKIFRNPHVYKRDE